jgi:hypothetical protein
MGTVIVRYKTTEEAAARNVELVQNVMAELAETEPEGLRYATFRLEDGVSFMHIAIEPADGLAGLRRVPARAR